jgi:hypothetical protein
MKRLLLAALLAGCAAENPDALELDATVVELDALAPDAAAPDAHPQRVVLDVDYQVQETGYWCGPAATRAALSVRMDSPPDQGTLAAQLGTTENGTDWIGQITAVLNDYVGAGSYATTEMPNDPPTEPQRAQLWTDLTYTLDHGFAVVANIVAPPSNHPPGYPDETIYHYFAVVGYDATTSEVYVADSANFSGYTLYWLSFDQLATLIPPKGYSALAAP